MEDIPGMGDYRKALNNAYDAWKQKNEEETDDVEVVSYLEALLEYSHNTKFKTLLVTDNGIGFNNKNMTAILSEGTPDKPSSSSGSHGIGHLTAFSLSNLQYLLYIGKNSNDSLFAGHAILASHPDEHGNNLSNHGYLVKKCTAKFNDKFVFYKIDKLPAKLKSIFKTSINNTGSMIIIPHFNYFHSQSTNKHSMTGILTTEIVKNYAMAFCTNKLKVNLFDKIIISIENIDKLVGSCLRDDPDNKDLILTACNIKTYFRSNENNTITLPNPYSDCKIILNNEVEKHCVSIWRNGMLITRNVNNFKKAMFPDNHAFDALIIVNGEQKDYNKTIAHHLLRSAESPMHDKIEVNKIKNDNDKQLFKKMLKLIKKTLKENSEEIIYEKFSLDDILLGNQSIGEFIKESGSLTVLKEGDSELSDEGSSQSDEEDIDEEENEPNYDNEYENEEEEDDSDEDDDKTTDKTKKEDDAAALKRNDLTDSFRQKARAISPDTWKLRLTPLNDIEQVQVQIFLHSGSELSCTSIITGMSISIDKITMNNTPISLSGHNTFLIGNVRALTNYDFMITFSSDTSHKSLERCIDCRFSTIKLSNE